MKFPIQPFAVTVDPLSTKISSVSDSGSSVITVAKGCIGLVFPDFQQR